MLALAAKLFVRLDVWLVMPNLVACLLIGCAAKKTNGKEDQDRIQGKWQMIADEAEGETGDPEFFPAIKVEFKGHKFIVTSEVPDDMGSYECTFSLNPNKTPKEIDLSAAINSKTCVFKGIYALESDKLILCADHQDRPRQFKTRQGAEIELIVFKRIKSKRDMKK